MPDRIALAFEEEEEYSAARLEALAAWKQAETEHALAVTHPAHAAGDHPRLPSGKVLRRVLKERYGRPSHP